ncbi:hypothetical protein EXIGLDRAFT_829266 [Exidia glandulosa HHB12029]|uniref:Protein kinase domain-containing protein n=1 Tax=Exidia glandulosa HHB12029 TaxID=1314781 RepID=A0A165PM66_EXIGL|nr:hypothetical protein EXIGLDRAFT_829266 [Exidia glandulosa HHB12029]
MKVDLSTFPKTLPDVRKIEGDVFTIWTPLKDFFLSNGLKLWVQSGTSYVRPPDGRPRTPDGFVYRYSCDDDEPSEFRQITPMIHPARTTDGRDVIIRLVSIGDSGANHREALQRLATGNVASVIGNHCVPVLQWIVLEDIHFAVQPLLSYIDQSTLYCYENVQDLINTIHQMLEALQFCHERLVAHMDIFSGNWLSNFHTSGKEATDFYEPLAEGARRKPFRSLFPFKIYLNDLECAVCFDTDSDPSSRVFSRPPIPNYGRTIPREMRSGLPYDPFPVDIWQLAGLIEQVPGFEHLPDALVEFVGRMRRECVEDRPSAKEAIAQLQALRLNLSAEELQAPVEW